MADLVNQQRVVGDVIVADGTTMYNNRPVVGMVSEASAAFKNNQVVQGVFVLGSYQPIYNEQPVIGAVVISDARTMYNGAPVVPASGLGPAVILSASTVLESAATNTVIGALSVVNHPSGSSGWTFAITSQTPSGNLNISGANLRTNAALDYETNASLSVVITASKSGQSDLVAPAKTITVTNVLEVTLGTLALSGLSYFLGVASSGAITGKTSGSTVNLSGSLPAGLSVDLTGMTWAWSGSGSASSGSFGLVETHADGANSPRTSTQAWSIEVAPELTVLIDSCHGDSNAAGNIADGTDTDYTNVFQFVTGSGGTADGGYTMLTPGLISDITPVQMNQDYTGTRCVGPSEWAARAIADAAPSYKIALSGNGRGAQRVSSTGHTIGPRPDTYTEAGITKFTAAVAAATANWPGATIRKMTTTFDSTNDLTAGVDPSVHYTAKHQQIADFLAISDVVVVVSTLPEAQAANNVLVETAQRIAALKSPNTYYCRITAGNTADLIHLSPTAKLRTVGYDEIGRVKLVALGLLAPTMPVITVTDASEHTETTDTEVVLGCDQPAYWSIDPATSDGSGALHPSVFTLSPDLEQDQQALRPAGGAWPAWDAGTPANNIKRVKLNYITGDRVIGSITRSVVIAEQTAIPWLARDTFNRTDVTPTGGGLGTTSGENGYGGGLTWKGFGGIESNKAVVGNLGDVPVNAECIVDCGQAGQDVRVTANTGGGRPIRIFAAATWNGVTADADNGPQIDKGVMVQTNGEVLYYIGSGISRTVGSGFTAPSDGTHDFRVTVDPATSTVTVYIDGVQVLQDVPAFSTTIDTAGHYAGMGIEYLNGTPRYENFGVLAF